MLVDRHHQQTLCKFQAHTDSGPPPGPWSSAANVLKLKLQRNTSWQGMHMPKAAYEYVCPLNVMRPTRPITQQKLQTLKAQQPSPLYESSPQGADPVEGNSSSNAPAMFVSGWSRSAKPICSQEYTPHWISFAPVLPLQPLSAHGNKRAPSKPCLKPGCARP